MGGGSLTVYGSSAGALGVENPNAQTITIELEDGITSLSYVAPFDCIVTIYSLIQEDGVDDHYVDVFLANTFYQQIVRDPRYNIATSIRAAKGQTVIVGVRGKGNRAVIRSVLPVTQATLMTELSFSFLPRQLQCQAGRRWLTPPLLQAMAM